MTDRRAIDSATDDGPRIAAAVADRSAEIVAALDRLDEAGLRAPSRLDGWSRLTIACHLRFGAETLTRMTADALAGRATSFYPGGRSIQRPGTLVPRPGEDGHAVVRSLADAGTALDRAWGPLDEGWTTLVTKPEDDRDLSPLPLRALALLRLTEVEVHGEDLGLGLSEWSTAFVTAALAFRLDWLNVRRRTRVAPDAGPASEGRSRSWLLSATDGPTFRVSISGTTVDSHLIESPADAPAAEPGEDRPDEDRPGEPQHRADAEVDAVIEGSSRDVLALLLGRPTQQPLAIRGDPAAAAEFTRTFPGP
jgi:uncharacterized protein (TIGR03083 family)